MVMFVLYHRPAGTDASGELNEQFIHYRTARTVEEAKAARRTFYDHQADTAAVNKLRIVAFRDEDTIPVTFPHEDDLNEAFEETRELLPLPLRC